MASIRKPRYRKDGTPYWSVLYVLDGKQTSSSFNDHTEALRFQELAFSGEGQRSHLATAADDVHDWMRRHDFVTA